MLKERLRNQRNLPGHSVFSTPENSGFYSSKPYASLDKTQKEIRLLKILPDDKLGLLDCELLPARALIEVKGTYNALSYCAGDSQKTDIVLVNGVKCNVFANLKHALAGVRYFWNKNCGDREFLLWVDQLCIDQSNIVERSHQVGFMRDIYQSAEQVLICLSSEKCSGLGMAWLVELYDRVPPLENDVQDEEDPFEDWEQESDGSLDVATVDRGGLENETQYDISRGHTDRLLKYISKNVVDQEFADGWIAFYDILNCQWWTRAWVFQEFITSSQSTFIYGQNSMAWTKLSTILNPLCSQLSQDFLLKEEYRMLRFPTNYRLYKGFDAGKAEDAQLRRVIDRATKDGSKKALASVNYMVKSKLKWSGRSDIKSLLAHSRYCKASDNRDRVYAFLGLGNPSYGITPDYWDGNSITQVLIDTTKKIVLFEDSLEVLCHAVNSHKDASKRIPSWPVDWTCPELTLQRGFHLGKKLSRSYSGLKRMKARCSFREVHSPDGDGVVTVLEVRGFCFDTLVSRVS